MPLPLILGIAAAVAGTSGVGLGIHGGVKMKRANDKFKEAQERDKKNLARFERMNKFTCREMDNLGKTELDILSGFKDFSKQFERLKNPPQFKDIKIGHVTIPQFEGEEIKKASVGAGVLLGGLGGAALGTAGAYAASGATTAAVMALGTASTGTAIASLSGVAATNATLAALGGGSLAAGGGGIALGTTILGAATLGAAFLVGGAIFSITGSKIAGKAEEAWNQMLKNESRINSLCNYLSELQKIAESYNSTLSKMRRLYYKMLGRMEETLDRHGNGRVEWGDLNKEEKTIVENTVLVTGVLYNMCKVQIVQKSTYSDQNMVNRRDINNATQNANDVLSKLSAVA